MTKAARGAGSRSPSTIDPTHAPRSPRLSVMLVALCIAVQIAYPLVSGDHRDIATGTIVLSAAVAMAIDAFHFLGPRAAVVAITVVPAVALTAEIIGTHSGFPFGAYMYDADRLWLRIGGVPVVVACAWLAGTWATWRVTDAALRRFRRLNSVATRALRVAGVAIGLVGWDLYLDPQMVSEGYWHWAAPTMHLPNIPSVPVTNFAGWIFVGVLLACGVELLIQQPYARERYNLSAREIAAPVSSALWVSFTWIGSLVAHLGFLDTAALAAGAYWGAIVMSPAGTAAVLIIYRCWRDKQRRACARRPHAAKDLAR